MNELPCATQQAGLEAVSTTMTPVVPMLTELLPPDHAARPHSDPDGRRHYGQVDETILTALIFM